MPRKRTHGSRRGQSACRSQSIAASSRPLVLRLLLRFATEGSFLDGCESIRSSPLAENITAHVATRIVERGTGAHPRRTAGRLPAQPRPAGAPPRLHLLEHAHLGPSQGLFRSAVSRSSSPKPRSCRSSEQPGEGAVAGQGKPQRTTVPYLLLRFPEVDGGRLNTILAIPSSMARKYALRRVSAGHESSNTALSASS